MYRLRRQVSKCRLCAHDQVARHTSTWTFGSNCAFSPFGETLQCTTATMPSKTPFYWRHGTQQRSRRSSTNVCRSFVRIFGNTHSTSRGELWWSETAPEGDGTWHQPVVNSETSNSMSHCNLFSPCRVSLWSALPLCDDTILFLVACAIEIDYWPIELYYSSIYHLTRTLSTHTPYNETIAILKFVSPVCTM